MLDGTTSDSSCSSTEDISKNVVYHLNNLNNKALGYCNIYFVYENIYSSISEWNMNAIDFKNITSNNIEICLNSAENTNCGYQNFLIDNGGFYWITKNL